MTRQCKNWLTSYAEYTKVTESPAKMHKWVGVSVLAGVLRRKVWIDMRMYKIYPSMFVIIVGIPGLVSKTTTLDVGMDLLRDVKGINFGPDVVTWQELACEFSRVKESFTWKGNTYDMSALTLASGELGNLIKPEDRELVTFYISMWDSKDKFVKKTKTSGSDYLEAPWINMIGCTTPDWIGANMPKIMVGGGFTSRCIFVYADQKERWIAYPDEEINEGAFEGLRTALKEDLSWIAENVVGTFTISDEARAWGRVWYQDLGKEITEQANSVVVQGYLARKYSFLHKIAMIMAISESDDRVIEKRHYELANQYLLEVQPDTEKVFSLIGRTEESLNSSKLLDYIQRKTKVKEEEVALFFHHAFPDPTVLGRMIEGLRLSGQITIDRSTGVTYYSPKIKGVS